MGFTIALCFALTGCADTRPATVQSQPINSAPSGASPEHPAESTAAADMREFFGASSIPLAPPASSCSGTRKALPHVESQSGYNRFTLQVHGASGNEIYGLKRTDFAASLDGHPLAVESFNSGANQGEVSLAIVVDTSGSMTPKLPMVLEALKNLLSSIDPCDEVALMAFSSHVFMLQPMTLQHDLVAQRLGLLHAYGQTAINDAVSAALKALDNATYQNRAILLITDGMDNASKTKLKAVLAEEKDRRVPIYAVGIGDPNAHENRETLEAGPSGLSNLEDIHRVDAGALNQLADVGGGRVWIISTVADDSGKSFDDAINGVAAALGVGYAVGVVVPPDTPAGAVPKFTIKGHPDAIVGATPDALIPATPLAQALRMPP
jgi:VWFA-related protein